MKVNHLIASILYGLGLILATLWLLASGPVTPVYADTFTVTNTAQSGPGSLRQAILDANSNPGHDVIDFGITGTLSPWTLPVIDDDLTITGPGATQLAVSGGNVRRVFEIAGGAAVTITGLTVCDGYALDYGGGIFSAGDLLLQNVRMLSSTAPYGGGIYISQGNATLNETQVVNNDANEGGGLYIAQGNVMLGGTQVLSNAAGYGGGIYLSQGNATLAETQVFNNEANEGGGLFIAQGNVTLSDTQVLSNAAGHGGGVYAGSSGITLTSSGGEISSNSAITYGGGVYVVAGNVALTGTQISNNVSSQGGGVYVNAGLITLHSAHIAGNYATFGGGIHIAGGNVALNDTQLVSNTATSGGGGVSLRGSGTTLSANNGNINYNSATQGGGLYVLQGHATVQGTQILGNKVFDGGGGVDILYGDATLNAVQIINNSSNRAGGGVHLRYSNAVLTMNGGEISSNSAITTGGGVHVAAGHATLGDVQILDNAAENGGGLFSNGGYVTVTQALIAGNQATGDGGGVCALYGFVTLTGTQVLSNTAGSEGGGVFVWEDLTTIDHTQLSHNAASTGGAGVTVHHGAAILNDSQVFSNTAPYGGGVYGVGGDTVLNRTQVFGNTGDRGGGISIYQGNVILNETHVFSNSANNGGGVYIDQHPAMLTMNGGEIRSNTAITSGGGVHMQQGRLALSGTQVRNNAAADDGGGVYVRYGTATLTETQVLTNVTADNGGGIFLYGDNATLIMTGGEIRRNNARVYGGGMYIDAGVATLHGTRVLSNTSTSHGGGVLVDKASAALTVDEGEINGNSGNYAGGVYINKGNVTLRRGSLDGNSASGRGGGMFIGTGNATLSEMRVSGNEATLGGGAFINLGSATLTGTQVLSNAVTGNGGGVYILQGTATLTGTQVLSNTAVYHGGGLFAAYDTTTLTVTAGKIANNSATTFGGGVHVAFANVTLSGTQILDNSSRIGGGLCTIHSEARVHVIGGEINHNRASDTGGGVHVITGSVTLSGTQVFNNASKDGGGVYVYSGTVTLNSTRVHSNTADAQGGGVHVAHGNATLNQAQITGNAAPDGSALYTGGVITPTTALTLTGDVYQAGGRFAGSAHDLRIEGALVLAGGDFYAPDDPNTLTLTGLYTHTGGTYHQTQIVDGDSDVGFPKEGGLFINANNISLGSTQVADTAGDDCIGITAGEAVSHCYIITPSSIWGDITATLTLYYQNAEAKPGHDCNVMEAYAWDGAWDTRLTRDGSYGDNGRLCGSDPQSIRVIDVTDFPTFTLRGPAPEIDVAPLTLDFGEQAASAGPTLSQTVTITNTGLADLHVIGIALSGDDAADFTITGGGEAVTLTTNSTHTVHIAFDPVSAGVKTATLTIHSDDADEPTVTVALSGTGLAAEIVVAPLALNFGEQDVTAGPTLAQCVTVTNTGNADLHVTGIALTGDAAADFLITSGGAPITLTGHSTHTIHIAFDPMTMGAKAAQLQILSDATGQATVNVALSGVGAAAPEIVVAPLALDFGEQGVDDGPTLSQTVTITNVGSTDLHIASVSLTGTDAAEFIIADDTGETPLTPGGTRRVQVAFAPISAGVKTATLTIHSNDADEPTVAVALSGTGLAAEIIVAPLALDFGEQDVTAGPTLAQCVTVTNTGNADLHVTGIALTGDAAADFLITSGGAPITLTGHSTHTIHIAFDPMTMGAKAAQLQILSDATGQATVNVALSGVGAAAPEIVVAPFALDFGEQEVDYGPTLSQTVTITNVGSTDLHLTAVGLTGDDAAEFTIADDTGETPLTPGAVRRVQVAFAPISAGVKTATLTIHSNDADEPTVAVALSGTGLAAEIVVTPLALDFGEQEVDDGPTLSQTVTITNVGSTDLHLTAVGLTGDDAAEFAIADDTGETTLTPGGTRRVQVAFAPVSAGVKTATLTIHSDDADEDTVNVTLSGLGTVGTYLLTVSKDGTGQGAVSSTPAGIACGEACQADFVAGTVVTLTATPDSGCTFGGWSGEGCDGTGVCRVSMDSAKHVTATFNNAPGHPGYGSTPAPGSALDLGTTNMGRTISATLSIFETGDMTLVVTPTVSGANAGDFSVTPSTLTIEDGGAAQTLTIACTPTLDGTRVATLTVAHNAPGGPALYSLHCTGGTAYTIHLPLLFRNH
ncbi:MAG TPA: choice-of-anchor D domain-containing protein [Anaerolineae bacterium]|nr:choice-of-anchor D domain-containing protein [Anaerolineae bacterium]